ncbi:nucleoid occlusion protein [Caldisalinibacter kiritimatiensis]|uniref:Chromosome (Plasmid) partitioning protein ParB / Stage 0 sporulation protein J n=1 Tax=Caldisalinibacter kiritimatiensis TaxID=1304284 RepID=R1CAT3_9FIRM|nr:nucleoid occlusion protein [Caldisalinibacter kiritimatiensis]EOC99424.1 Chromosome (plasmid) partitioning protein ParB / Stage 0 sporulation protein J [Caldisalinibacter kiritimatiensis]
MSEKREIKYIPIEQIKPNPYQPRKSFSKRSLEELSQSIKAYGVIQPISVRKLAENSYELVAGERRLRASEMANLESIPAIVVEMKDKDSAAMALIENLQRRDLNFIEEAEAYYNLINDHGMTQQELAEKIGKNQSTVANKLRILRLPVEVKKMIIENGLTERHARALLKLPDKELQIKVLEKVIKNELNVKKTEKLIKDILEDITSEKEKENKQRIKNLINFRIYLNTLKNAYNAIKESGVDAEYKQKDKGDFIEVVVKIPKNKKTG